MTVSAVVAVPRASPSFVVSMVMATCPLPDTTKLVQFVVDAVNSCTLPMTLRPTKRISCVYLLKVKIESGSLS